MFTHRFYRFREPVNHDILTYIWMITMFCSLPVSIIGAALLINDLFSDTSNEQIVIVSWCAICSPIIVIILFGFLFGFRIAYRGCKKETPVEPITQHYVVDYV